MIEFLILAGVVDAILFLTAAVVLPILFAEYVHFRRSAWIAVTPAMVPVGAEQIPPVLALVLDKARPVLEPLGFKRVAMAHAPTFQAGTTWFHVLLVNRPTGERAGVMYYGVEGATPYVNLTLAAEFTHGDTVVTSWGELFPDARANVTINPDAVASQVSSLHDLHRSKMAKLASREARTPVLPAEGEVLRWMQAKATAVTAALAKDHFEVDASGHYYVPTRRHALRLVARNFSAIPAGRSRQTPAGFPVIVPGNRP
jgi:hypothetical protein